MTPEQASQLSTLYNLRIRGPWQYKGTDEPLDAYAFLRGTNADVKTLASKVAALSTKVDAIQPELTPAQLEALAAQVSTSPTLAETIAEKVAEKLAARLAD